jgi:hypothetical protein
MVVGTFAFILHVVVVHLDTNALFFIEPQMKKTKRSCHSSMTSLDENVTELTGRVSTPSLSFLSFLFLSLHTPPIFKSSPLAAFVFSSYTLPLHVRLLLPLVFCSFSCSLLPSPSLREDMNGTGSFLRENRTLYVGAIRKVPDLDDVLYKQFGEWGDIETLRFISSKSIAFVTYRLRTAAEFAKEAMADQSIAGTGILLLLPSILQIYPLTSFLLHHLLFILVLNFVFLLSIR